MTFSLFALTSCEAEGPECYEPVVVNVTTLFRTLDSVEQLMADSTIAIVMQPKDTILKSPAFTALDLDSIYYYIVGNYTSTMGVALNPSTANMRYSVQTDTASALADTLTFYYQSVLHFISNNCGYTNYFILDSIHITNNLFDSAVLSNPDVTSDVAIRHVHLYLHQ